MGDEGDWLARPASLAYVYFGHKFTASGTTSHFRPDRFCGHPIQRAILYLLLISTKIAVSRGKLVTVSVIRCVTRTVIGDTTPPAHPSRAYEGKHRCSEPKVLIKY